MIVISSCKKRDVSLKQKSRDFRSICIESTKSEASQTINL